MNTATLRTWGLVGVLVGLVGCSGTPGNMDAGSGGGGETGGGGGAAGGGAGGGMAGGTGGGSTGGGTGGAMGGGAGGGAMGGGTGGGNVNVMVTSTFDFTRWLRGSATIGVTVDPSSASSLTGAVGATTVCTDTSAPFECAIDTTTLADGQPTLVLTAAAGGSTGQLTATLKIDNTPPQVAPITGPGNNGLAVVSPGQAITIDGLTDATSGLANAEARVNGQLFASGLKATTTADSYELTLATTLPADGEYPADAGQISVTDNAGNVRVVGVPFPIYIDSAPPQVTLTPPADVTLTPTFTATATDQGTGIQAVEFSLDGTLLDFPSCPRRATANQAAAPLVGPFTCQLQPAQVTGSAQSLTVKVFDRSGGLTEPEVRFTEQTVTFTADGMPRLTLGTFDTAVARRTANDIVIPFVVDTRGATGTLSVGAPSNLAGACTYTGTMGSCTLTQAQLSSYTTEQTVQVAVQLVTARGMASVTVPLRLDPVGPQLVSRYPALPSSPGELGSPQPRLYLQFNEPLEPTLGAAFRWCLSNPMRTACAGQEFPADTFFFSTTGTKDSVAVLPTAALSASPDGFLVRWAGLTDLAGNPVTSSAWLPGPGTGSSGNRRTAAISVVTGSGEVPATVVGRGENRNHAGVFSFDRGGPTNPTSILRLAARFPVHVPPGEDYMGTALPAPSGCTMRRLGAATGTPLSCPTATLQLNTSASDDEQVSIEFADVNPMRHVLRDPGVYQLDVSFWVPDGQNGNGQATRQEQATFFFTVNLVDGSTQPPTLSGTLPAANGALSTGAILALSFENELNLSTLAAGLVLRRGTTVVPAEPSLVPELGLISLDLSTPLSQGSYTLELTTALKTVGGVALAAPVTLPFTVAADNASFTAQAITATPAPLATAPSGRLARDEAQVRLELPSPVLLSQLRADIDLAVHEVVGTDQVAVPVRSLETGVLGGPQSRGPVSREVPVQLRYDTQPLREDGLVRVTLRDARRVDGTPWNLASPVTFDYRASSSATANAAMLPSLRWADVSVDFDLAGVTVQGGASPSSLCTSLSVRIDSAATAGVDATVTPGSDCRFSANLPAAAFTTGVPVPLAITVANGTLTDRRTVSVTLPGRPAYVAAPEAGGLFVFDAGVSTGVAVGQLTTFEAATGTPLRRFFARRVNGNHWEAGAVNAAATYPQPSYAVARALFVTGVTAEEAFAVVEASHARVLATPRARALASIDLGTSGFDTDKARVYAFDEEADGPWARQVLNGWATQVPAVTGAVLGFDAGVDSSDPVRVTQGCRFGGCLEFDGVDDVVSQQLTGAPTFSLGGSFSIDLWVRPARAYGQACASLETLLGRYAHPNCNDAPDLDGTTSPTLATAPASCVPDLPANQLQALFSLAPAEGSAGLEVMALTDCGGTQRDQLLVAISSSGPGGGFPVAIVRGPNDTNLGLAVGQWAHVGLAVETSPSGPAVRLVVNGVEHATTFVDIDAIPFADASTLGTYPNYYASWPPAGNGTADETSAFNAWPSTVNAVHAGLGASFSIRCNGTPPCAPGQLFPDPRNGFAGRIDDFAFFTRAQSAAELIQHHTRQSQ